MVKLHELTVRFLTLFLSQNKRLARFLLEASFLLQVGIISRKAVRSFAVGPALQLHLQHSQIYAHLNDLAIVAPMYEPGLNLAWLVWPVFKGVVDVTIHETFCS